MSTEEQMRQKQFEGVAIHLLKLNSADACRFDSIDRTSEELEAAYQLGLSKGREEWISVQDRMPEIGVCVLIRIDSSDECVTRNAHWQKPIFTGMRSDDGEWWSYGAHCGGGPKKGSVTHWQPLPEPPKEKP